MKIISIELYKLRHKRITLMLILFLFVEIAWTFMATSKSISRNPENATWEMLIAIIASMNGLFLPILTAICVSRICDMEHKGDTLKLLLSTSMKRGELYAAKYVSAAILMLLVSILQIFSIMIFGIINNFKESVPLFLFVRLLIGTTLTSLIVIAFQQWISMAVKNQAFSLCLGMIGGFIGMTADLFPAKVRSLFIWSYYTGLSPVTQSYANEKIQFIIRDVSSLIPAMAALIVVGICIYMVGSFQVSRQEI